MEAGASPGIFRWGGTGTLGGGGAFINTKPNHLYVIENSATCNDLDWTDFLLP